MHKVKRDDIHNNRCTIHKVDILFNKKKHAPDEYKLSSMGLK